MKTKGFGVYMCVQSTCQTNILNNQTHIHTLHNNQTLVQEKKKRKKRKTDEHEEEKLIKFLK